MMIRKVPRVFLCAFISILLYNTPSLADTTVGGLIAADTTWTLANSPYVVTSTVQVYGTTTTPVTLTIQPGVIVKFNAGTGLYIGNGTNQGALVSRGTTTQRITFTRSGASGSWAGLNFQDGTVDATTIIENADIQYADTGATMTSAAPTIKDSTINATSTTGYSIYLQSSSPILSNVTMNNAGLYGIMLYMLSSPTISGGSITNTNPAGYGIYGNGSPVISNLTVSIVDTPGKYGVNLTQTTSSLSITNSTIGNGLYLGSSSITPAIIGNTFTNCDHSPIHAGAKIIGAISANNTFTGMTSAGKIDVVAETIDQDTLWKKLPAPYVLSGALSIFKDSTTAATLTIEAGSTIKLPASAALSVGSYPYKGALIARGTPSDRILFTRDGTSGVWGGLVISAGTGTATFIEYADIQLASTGIRMTSTSPSIKDSTISATSASGYGIYLSASSPVLNNVSVTNDGQYGIYLYSNSSPTIIGGSITNTHPTGYGIYSDYGSNNPSISNYTISISNTGTQLGSNLQY